MATEVVFVTEETLIKYPEWFVEKYKDSVFFNKDRTGVIASQYSGKMKKLQLFLWKNLVKFVCAPYLKIK